MHFLEPEIKGVPSHPIAWSQIQSDDDEEYEDTDEEDEDDDGEGPGSSAVEDEEIENLSGAEDAAEDT